MKILAVDTSSSYLSLAVLEEDKVICEVNKNLQKANHCKLLIPYLERMLTKAKIKIDKIDAFCVGLGPGSFTGLRVGLAAFKALSFACKKRLIGISSMDAIALNIQDEKSIIACIKDARKDKVYGCLYLRNKNLKRLTGYLLLELEEFLKLVEKISKKEKKQVIFTADGVDVFKKDILRIMPEVAFSPREYWRPKAANLAREALLILKKKKKLKSYEDIEPLYLHSQYVNITKPKKL